MNRKVFTISALLTGLLVILATSFALAGGPRDKAQIFAIGDDGLTTEADDPEPVVGSWSMLEREDDAVHGKIRTRIEGGHVYTLWWVIFNNPAACDATCGEDDVFVDPADHPAGFRVDQIEAVQISAVWGGGAVANSSGRWKLDSTLREGEPPAGERQVLIGTADGGAFIPIAVVEGLTNPQGAEFLLLIQDHGPAHEDADLLEEQLTTFLGACNPESADLDPPMDPGSCAEVQFAVHR